jgi:hypothetical protein
MNLMAVVVVVLLYKLLPFSFSTTASLWKFLFHLTLQPGHEAMMKEWKYSALRSSIDETGKSEFGAVAGSASSEPDGG